MAKFINQLKDFGFNKSISGNLNSNQYHYEQYIIELNTNGWILYYQRNGIAEDNSFEIKDLFKSIMDHCSRIKS